MWQIEGRWKEYREAVGLWPSQPFFRELLEKEISQCPDYRIFSDLDQALLQLEEIWNAPDREALLKLIESQEHRKSYQLKQQGPTRYAVDFEERLAESLKRLIVAPAPGKMARYKADLAISRLLKLLSPEKQRAVLEPWFLQSARHKRVAVVRCLSRLDDVRGLGEVLFLQYMREQSVHNFQLVARDADACALIQPDHLQWYFNEYLEEFKNSQKEDLNRGAKFRAMVAAKVLIHGGHPVTEDLKRDIPEILCWAITELGGKENEELLLQLMKLHPQNPELLWGVVKGAPSAFMASAYGFALYLGYGLLAGEELDF